MSLKLTELSVRRVIGATLVVTAVVFAFWLLFRFHEVVLILFLAIAIGTSVRPAVAWLGGHGVPRPVGAVLVYLFLGGLLAGLVRFSLPPIAEQVSNIVQQMPELYTGLRDALLGVPNFVIYRIALVLPEQLPQLTPAVPEAAVMDEAVDRLGQLLEWVSLGMQAIFGTIATFILAFYWTLNGERARRALLLLLPPDKRDGARDLMDTIEAKIRGYVIGQGVLVVIVGLMALVAYLLIGLPNALLLALIAGVLEAVPIIGPVLGAVPALLVAFSLGTPTVLWVILAALLIQQLENSLLVPRVMGRTVGVNPIVALLALLAFGSLFGVLGALMAIPMAAVIQSLLDRYLLSPQQADKVALGGRGEVSVLRYETQELVRDMRSQRRGKDALAGVKSPTEADARIEDALEAIAADLDLLLAQQDGAEDGP